MNSSKSCELKLDYCSFEAAKYAVEHWHYSKSMPVGKLVKIGVWEDSQFIGVIIFARGANNNLLKPYGLDQTEGCELVRVALREHIAPVSRMIRVALKLLQKQSPGMKLVISFADTREGHHGGIYQAGGWIYVGSCEPPTEYLLDGRWVHSMQIQTMIRSGRIKSRHGLPKRPGSAKHRYLYPLTSEMRAKIEPLRKPYPKPASANRTTPADLAGAEGASPIQTL